MSKVPPEELARARTLLLDVDGNLCPSEEPAFEASAVVVNRFLADLGLPDRVEAGELLATGTGRNFRSIAAGLARSHGATLTGPVLDRWADEEKKVVSDPLGRVLRPDPDVLGAVHRLAGRYRLAAVSSSALSRLDVCFHAIGLAGLIPPESRFSAEDSLPQPVSKPDPAVYQLACAQLGIEPGQALAVEDSRPGVQSAVAAGILTVGNVTFVAGRERAARTATLLAAGAAEVFVSWPQLAAALAGPESSQPR